ncbi:MAG: hypothetical protein B6D45_07545, partial [Ignavibacteriales bacterium UTCHB3]
AAAGFLPKNRPPLSAAVRASAGPDAPRRWPGRTVRAPERPAATGQAPRPQPEPDSLLAVKYNLSLIKLSKEETALLGSYAPKIPPNDPAIYTFYDEPASFLNGEDEFYSRLFYPSRAIEDGLEGTVIIRALIRTDGTVESTEVAQPLGLGCEGSAEVTVKYTLFNPAKIKGRPVNAWVDIPVVFKLPNKN